jgi:hypothetical protein
MTVGRQPPRRPASDYHQASARRIIRCCWNRMIIALAIRGILILYALLKFVLSRCRTE